MEEFLCIQLFISFFLFVFVVCFVFCTPLSLVSIFVFWYVVSLVFVNLLVFSSSTSSVLLISLAVLSFLGSSGIFLSLLCLRPPPACLGPFAFVCFLYRRVLPPLLPFVFLHVCVLSIPCNCALDQMKYFVFRFLSKDTVSSLF